LRKLFQRFVYWFSTPQTSPDIKKQNFVNVQIDAIGVGLSGAASPFLPVFLARLGASSFEVSLLSSMPAVAGFLFSLPLGRYLQRKSKIIPWFSNSRLVYYAGYGLTGLIGFLVPREHLVFSILLIWGLLTIPQTVTNICFSLVMNSVAGPKGRFELMSRRWSLFGITNAVIVFVIGQILALILFPLNFQVVFIMLSIGSLISYYFSININIPEQKTSLPPIGKSLNSIFTNYAALIRLHPNFKTFVLKRFVYSSGTAMTLPLLPLYFVRVVQASDAWIAAFNTAATATLLFGYFFWIRKSRQKNSRFVLLWSTLGMSIYPLLVSQTQQVWLILLLAGLSGIFTAGTSLTFFDEFLKTVPEEYGATFISLGQSMEHFAMILFPIFASILSLSLGVGTALFISGLLRLVGFGLFYFDKGLPKVELPRVG
jgi:MFS family permease